MVVTVGGVHNPGKVGRSCPLLFAFLIKGPLAVKVYAGKEELVVLLLNNIEGVFI